MKDTLQSVIDTIPHIQTVISDISRDQLVTHYQNQISLLLWILGTVVVIAIAIISGIIANHKFKWDKQVQSLSTEEAERTVLQSLPSMFRNFLETGQAVKEIEPIVTGLVDSKHKESLEKGLEKVEEKLLKQLNKRIDTNELSIKEVDTRPDIIRLNGMIADNFYSKGDIKRLYLNLFNIQLCFMHYQEVDVVIYFIKALTLELEALNHMDFRVLNKLTTVLKLTVDQSKSSPLWEAEEVDKAFTRLMKTFEKFVNES